MSQTIYLVQARHDFRFAFSETVAKVIYADDTIKAFSSLAAARRWVSNATPNSLNPFVGFYEDEEDFSLLLLSENSDEDEDNQIMAKAMRTFLRSLGLAPPIFRAKRVSATPWHDWWEATATNMTEAQKSAIWKFLVPTPYRIVEVEME